MVNITYSMVQNKEDCDPHNWFGIVYYYYGKWCISFLSDMFLSRGGNHIMEKKPMQFIASEITEKKINKHLNDIISTVIYKLNDI